RPEDPRYVRSYTARQRRVLAVRPGITSLASLRYRHEEKLLPEEDAQKIYLENIMPAKLDIELAYIDQASFSHDLLIILATLFAIVGGEDRLEWLSNTFGRLENWLAQNVPWLILDIPLILLAYVLGLAVRSVNARIAFGEAVILAFGCVFVYLTANYLFGIYNRFWRYASGQEAVALLLSSSLATLAITGISFFLQRRDLPLGAIWMGGLFTFIFITAARYRRRLLSGMRQTVVSFLGLASAGRGARVLIVGAGEEGQLLAWQLQNRLQGQAYQVIGFIDSDRRKLGMRIHNVPVLGDRADIPRVAAELHPDLIVIAIPPSKVQHPRELLSTCRATAAQVKILPGFFDWLGQSGAAPGWADVDEADLLQRRSFDIDDEACRGLIAGRVVMVTGAAGSIGGELCRQIAGFAPSRLVLVDINETGLHDLGIELRNLQPDLTVDLVLADITNQRRMERYFALRPPQIVFHVAAYKHVPMLEMHPQEGIRVNVLGTRLMHRLADRYGVERFVLISTDKAVNPTNVLGMTKWLGELLMTQHGPESGMLSTAVRFGNVLGSRGSVIPIFEKQIELGGPITITDPEMSRYFLTIREAVSLVIQAAAMTGGGDLYVLDMGVPLPIIDLAQRLIRAHGLRPGKDIEIRVIGARPGEKLTEELVAEGEERVGTEHPSIFRICRNRPLNLNELEQQVDALANVTTNGATPEAANAALANLVHSIAADTVSTGLRPAMRGDA
ncbi:MAG: polysaccharide biosynthesis protein, partial [Rudaea sp.]